MARGRRGWSAFVRVVAVAAVLIAGTATAGAVPAPAYAAALAWPVVRSGQSGPVVLTVQRLLRHHGATIVADGAFGPATAGAVRDFQDAHGLTVDGAVGGQTWPELEVPLDSGDSGEAVRALQEQLARHGKTPDTDGVFGAATGEAVTAFKADHDLDTGTAVDVTVWQWLVGSVPAGEYGGPITRSEVLVRAKDWWDRQVPYSQTSYTWDINHGKTYRQDCSGFVSMPWKLTTSLTTYTLDEVSFHIEWDELQPGDIVLSTGHVKRFEKWTDQTHTVMWIYEQGNSATDMDHETVSVATLRNGAFLPWRTRTAADHSGRRRRLDDGGPAHRDGGPGHGAWVEVQRPAWSAPQVFVPTMPSGERPRELW